MNRWLLAAYLIFAAPLLAEGKSAKDTVQNTLLSVVKILSINADGEVLLGSGFFVAKNVIATNFHVIKNLRNGTINVIGQKPQYPILRIIASDENSDIALLRVSDVKAAPLIFGDSQTVAVGEVVYAIGNSGGLGGTISHGIIIGLREGRIVETNAPLSPESTGGPLLNEAGEVIGIIRGSDVTDQNLNFAMPAIELQQLMNRSGIRYASRPTVVPSRNAPATLQPNKAAPLSPSPRDLPEAENMPEPLLHKGVSSMLANAGPIRPRQPATEAPANALERCPPKAQRYCPVLQAAINHMWNSQYYAALRQMLESAGSSALMLIKIRPDGMIQSIVLKESSGNRSYDLAIESLLWHQERFPPLPEEMRDETFQALLYFRH
jgi:hypothetical protein